MRNLWISFVAVILSLLPMNAAAEEKPSVTVFEATKIITMEASLPEARYVAVADGIILATADSLEELKPWTAGRNFKIDRRFAKNILMPGLIDPHVHPMQSAVMINIPFIAPDDWKLPGGKYPGARTPADYRKMLRAMLAKAADGPFITWGHHVLFHGEIDREELDEIAPDRPVVIWQRSFHEVIMNSAALAHFGFPDETAFDKAIRAAKADPHHNSYAKGVFSETGLLIAVAKMRPLILSPAKLTE